MAFAIVYLRPSPLFRPLSIHPDNGSALLVPAGSSGDRIEFSVSRFVGMVGALFQVRGLPCTAKEASNTLCGCVHKVEVYGSVLDRAL